MASAAAEVPVQGCGSLLAYRYPGLVPALEPDTQPPLGQEHVIGSVLVRVMAEVRQPGDTHPGVDQDAHDRGVAAVLEARPLTGLEQRGKDRKSTRLNS